MVGTFTKGIQSFRKVSQFVDNFWRNKGLSNVYQKDASTFIFKFSNISSRNAFLARGTWYIGKRPMVVTAWGVKPGENIVETLPLWIKLSNIPMCYWTDEGLSRLASVIGRPLGADNLTAKLDMIPFAKICVQYTIGSPLPNEIQANVLDPVSNEITVENVEVSYPFRPLVCVGCKSLGHTAAACPKIKRVWIQKTKEAEKETVCPVPECHVPTQCHGDLNQTCPAPEVAQQELGLGAKNTTTEDTQFSTPGKDEGWVEVKRKGHPSASIEDYSPTPPHNFKNLKSVDEIDQKKAELSVIKPASRLSRKKQKRQRNSLGKSSPPLSH